jgi:hypothetical protein
MKMNKEDQAWDQKLKEKFESFNHPTRVEWSQVHSRLAKKKRVIQLKRWLMRVAAIFVGIFIAYSVMIGFQSTSWEYTPVASISNLDQGSTESFSASELHHIYSTKD